MAHCTWAPLASLQRINNMSIRHLHKTGPNQKRRRQNGLIKVKFCGIELIRCFMLQIKRYDYKTWFSACIKNFIDNSIYKSIFRYNIPTLPLTARLMSISSKGFWSSMAATSQRYCAESDLLAFRIRRFAGSLSIALCSKSPEKIKLITWD